ncbi:hypothetical protein F5Y19DRAFT_268767 [Xylariaceae sp. FL1651]|nr:hypothetical protein F5Y19DRAFT_268767 [Xylariaceae sp. FL1651]
MKFSAILLMPLAALAAPKATISKRFDNAPFAPDPHGLTPYQECSSYDFHKDNLAHTAPMLDCVKIANWARGNNGEWILKATTDPGDDNDWQVLQVQDGCALAVKNTEPTSVGNKDVAGLIDAIYLSDGVRLDPIEEKGHFIGCRGGGNVQFWLRDSNI